MSSVIPTIATVIGSTVSSAVYNGIVTAGDMSAAATSKSISLLGISLGYGADLLGRNHIATTLRATADAGATVVSPTIKATSKTLAFGASIVAGTVAGLATAGIAHGSIKLYELAKSTYDNYKEPVYKAVTDAAAVAADATTRQMLGTDDPEVLEVAYDDVVELRQTI
jgi:hypothetical protein